jgi:hypothetical protein
MSLDAALGTSLLSRFNDAVRRPSEHGGLAVLPLLLDQLAAAERQSEEIVWIPDVNARLSPAGIMRAFFPDPEVHIAASQYGEDAFRRGWLRLDRTLDAAEFAQLIDSVLNWAEVDRTIHDVVAEYGPVSVTFGDLDPRRPKTLAYAGTDRDAPFVTFHLGAAPTESEAVLLGVRTHEDFFGGWTFTPHGERVSS